MKPLVSFFATAYKQKQFLRGYFENLLSINGFDKCELVLVKPKTIDEEENEIYREYSYVKNFKIIETKYDLGLYQSWNLAIKNCKADILSNANTDDRRLPDCLDSNLNILNNGADLVYSDCYIAETTEQLEYPFLCGRRSVLPEFSIENMIKYCLPGHAPFWKKKLMDDRGFRGDFESAGDLDFWLRSIRNGAKFKKLNKLTSVYYYNPKGQSTDPVKNVKKSAIEAEIKRQYAKVFFYSGPTGGKIEDIWVSVH